MVKTMLLAALSLNMFLFWVDTSEAETIVKKQRLSYEMCLKVINETSDKLSITPKITVDNSEIRKVEYSLSDGQLIIICDKISQEILISSR